MFQTKGAASLSLEVEGDEVVLERIVWSEMIQDKQNLGGQDKRIWLIFCTTGFPAGA